MLNASCRPLHGRRASQQGVLLLEVLIAILIFALGVLGLVGLQATAIKQSGQSKYRADATLLANELIGQMWLTNRTYTTLSAQFSSAGPGASYTAWATRVSAALPGSASLPPTVTVTEVLPLNAIVGGVAGPAPSTLTSSSRVTITMNWQAPGESTPHNVVLINEIK